MSKTTPSTTTMARKETVSYCLECYHYCPVKVTVENGTIARVEGNPLSPYSERRLCPKGNAAPMRLYDPNRLKTPLIRTNPKKGIGVDPQWREASWEEALRVAGDRLRAIMRTNPSGIKFTTREHPRMPISECIATALGSRYGDSGAGTGGRVHCGNSVHNLGHQIWGSTHDWPEYTFTRYVVLMGSNTGFESDRAIPVDAKNIADARMRGMKLVVVDPRFTHAAAKADEWIAIRPGTDCALILGITNLLLNEYDIWDSMFLQRFTNAPYLIGPDGYYVVDPASQKPLMWDVVDRQAVPYDAFGTEATCQRAALQGEYQVHGAPCKPAFQMYKDRVREYTPERVEGITTVPAGTVRRIAREFGENAQIGSTVEIEGQRWPVRGSIVVFYRGTQGHVHSAQTTMAVYALEMIVGAMGVPGGTLPALGSAFGVKSPVLRSRPDGTVAFDFGSGHPHRPPVWPPTEYDLINYLPWGVGPSHVHHITGREPQKWGLNPEIFVFVDNNNPVMTVGDLEAVGASLGKAFVAVCEQYLSETAELADVVFPSDFQLERCSLGAVKAGAGHLGIVYSQPAVAPAGQCRDPWDVALDLADQAGVLCGEGGVNYWVNMSYKLKPQYALSLEETYTVAQIQERVGKNAIGEEGWQKLVAQGVYTRRVPAAEKYLPFGGARLAFYNEAVKRAGNELVRGLKENGAYDRVAAELDLSAYDALPKWMPGPIHEPGNGFDLFAVNGKSVIFAFTRSLHNPWLVELGERDPYVFKIWINRATAQKKGIRDGQLVCVESSAAKVQGEAKVTDGIHPECVGISGCLGNWSQHPVSKGKGVHFNTLLEVSLKNTDPICATMQGAAVRVKVYPVK